MEPIIRCYISDTSADLIWSVPNSKTESKPGARSEIHHLETFPLDLIRFLYLDLSELEELVAAAVKPLQAAATTGKPECVNRAWRELTKLHKLHPYLICTEFEWKVRLSEALNEAGECMLENPPLERLTALPDQLRQVQEAGLDLIAQVLDLDRGEASLQERMKQYAAKHKREKTPCYQFRKLTTCCEQVNGIYLEILYPQEVFDLIDYALALCLQKGLRFRVCKNCGRYFAISRSAKAEYCDTFPDENGRTCRNVGAITAYTKKRENDEVFKTYRREYKKRFARIRAGALRPDEFYTWSEQARQKKEALEREEIDLETFLDWLANS